MKRGAAGTSTASAIKKLRVYCVIGVFLLVSVWTAGCLSTLPTGNNSTTLSNQLDRVEVYHFHRTQQCYSCVTLGAYAEETVKTKFPAELSSGKVIFGHINIDLPENKELVERYGATGSSLWIGVYNETGFYKEQDTHVWYKIGDKEAYITYLSDLIQRRMNGDFS